MLFGGLLAFSTFSAANNKSSESFGIYLDQSEYSNRIRRSSPIENGTSSLDESESEAKNCSEPAYKEFPSDGLTSQQRSSGAIVIHILLVSLYSLLIFT